MRWGIYEFAGVASRGPGVGEIGKRRFYAAHQTSDTRLPTSDTRKGVIMKRILLILLLAAAPLRAAGNDAASVLARADVFRNPIPSFSVDVELMSVTPDGKSNTSRFRVYGKGADRSIVEFTYPQTEKGKYLLMLRDAMWIYMPTSSRPIRISPLQRLMGQASNGDVARTSFIVDYDAKSVTEDGDAFVLDLVAKDPAVAYNRVRLW